MRECSLLGCGREHWAKGLCSLHYNRKRNGRPLDAPLNYRRGPRQQPLDWAKCGTPGNYRLHIRRGEKACEPCLQAECRRTQDSYRRRRERVLQGSSSR